MCKEQMCLWLVQRPRPPRCELKGASSSCAIAMSARLGVSGRVCLGGRETLCAQCYLLYVMYVLLCAQG